MNIATFSFFTYIYFFLNISLKDCFIDENIESAAFNCLGFVRMNA